jgi:predicted AAA+ superfamily ATPase
MVFTALRRISPDIFYFKTKTGKEVDFIVKIENGFRMLIQVCESLADPLTKKREVTALAEAMAELKLSTGTIVTRGENEKISLGDSIIEVVPAWRFLLSFA